MAVGEGFSSLRQVTYSPAYTLVPTYECFNRCSYCNFRTDPGQDTWLTLDAARSRLDSLQSVIEILLLSGEVHPQSSRRQSWFQHIYDLCQLALDCGFLPHTNVGPLSFDEMAQLRAVNVSMGLMLEQLTPKLQTTVHRQAPSKDPQLRLQQLEWAGQLKIPFTTGLLLGIGESVANQKETLEAIARIHQQWGHIQEVILQPHSLGETQVWSGESFAIAQLPDVIQMARQILPDTITLQVPPNLISDPALLLACVEAGAWDLGGIGPVDEVNPDYLHLHKPRLTEILQSAGWGLTPRLPVYPQYDSWLPPTLQVEVERWREIKEAGII